MRKRQQIDGLSELPEAKRPPDSVLWHSNPDRLKDWLDDVLERKDKKENNRGTTQIPLSEIEG